MVAAAFASMSPTTAGTAALTGATVGGLGGVVGFDTDRATGVARGVLVAVAVTGTIVRPVAVATACGPLETGIVDRAAGTGVFSAPETSGACSDGDAEYTGADTPYRRFVTTGADGDAEFIGAATPYRRFGTTGADGDAEFIGAATPYRRFGTTGSDGDAEFTGPDALYEDFETLVMVTCNSPVLPLYMLETTFIPRNKRPDDGASPR